MALDVTRWIISTTSRATNNPLTRKALQVWRTPVRQSCWLFPWSKCPATEFCSLRGHSFAGTLQVFGSQFENTFSEELILELIFEDSVTDLWNCCVRPGTARLIYGQLMYSPDSTPASSDAPPVMWQVSSVRKFCPSGGHVVMAKRLRITCNWRTWIFYEFVWELSILRNGRWFVSIVRTKNFCSPDFQILAGQPRVFWKIVKRGCKFSKQTKTQPFRMRAHDFFILLDSQHPHKSRTEQSTGSWFKAKRVSNAK